MWFLYVNEKGQFITSVVKKRTGKHALYYRPEPVGCRWGSRRMADRCIDRLVLNGTLGVVHAVSAVWVEVKR
jgi:hypothetical protein